MHFKATRPVLNSSRQELTMNLLDVVDEVSLLSERKENGVEEFKKHLNERFEEIGGKKNNAYMLWKTRVGRTESRFKKNGTLTADEERIITLQRRFDENFCASYIIHDHTQNGTATVQVSDIQAPENNMDTSGNFDGRDRGTISSFGATPGDFFGNNQKSSGAFGGRGGDRGGFGQSSGDDSQENNGFASSGQGRGGSSFGRGNFGNYNNDGNQEGSGFGRGPGGRGGGGTFSQRGDNQTNTGRGNFGGLGGGNISQPMSNLSAEDVAQRHLINIVNKYSLSVQDGKITQEEFANRLNSHHVALGLPEYNVHNTWMRLVRNVEDQFKNNGGRFANENHERIASFQQRIDPTFCNPAGEIPAAESTVQEERVQVPEQSSRAPENMGVTESNFDRVRGRRIIMHSSRHDRGRVGRNRAILLTQDQRLEAIQAAEAVSIQHQKGSAFAKLGFLQNTNFRAWNSVLEECKEKSHNIGSVWTELDKRIFDIEYRMSKDTSEWGPLARPNQSPTQIVMDKSSINMPESSNTHILNGANSNQGSPETHASKRKLVAADTVPPTKQSSTLLSNRSRTFPTCSAMTDPASSQEQRRNPAATQNSSKQSVEARQTHPSSNQVESKANSSQIPSNSPNIDSTAASSPRIQEAQKSQMAKQMVQISTTMKYGTYRYPTFKLVSLGTDIQAPVIQILLPKNVSLHLCHGISDLSHITQTLLPRVTTQVHQPNNAQAVGIRMVTNYSILEMDDDDDKNKKIICLGANQEPLAVITLPCEYGVLETWTDETHRMIEIPVVYDPIFDATR